MKKIDDLAQLKRLVMFTYVVELGSFAKAAEKLGMNRSGISEQISMLEQYLNMRLLNRTTRSLSLTSDGEAVLPQAKLVAKTMQTIRSSLSEELLHGRVRISTSNDFAIGWLNKKIKRFQNNYTGIAFDLVVSDKQNTVLADDLDLSFFMGDIPSDNSLIAKPILRERLQVYASPEFLENIPAMNAVEKLNNVNWILLKELEHSNKIVLHKRNTKETVSLQPALFGRVSSSTVLTEQVKLGMGVGLILPSMITHEIKRGEMVQVLPEWVGDEITFSTLYSAHKTLARRAKLFLDFLYS